jgi:hypothetical protein
MRKIAGSGNTAWSTRLSSRADARSRPNGFSTITRASFAALDLPRPSTTVANKLGGMAR